MIDPCDLRARHFLALGREVQIAVVRRLATIGHSARTIASATRLPLEAVRRILDEGR